MQRRYDKHRILYSFDMMLENLPHQLPGPLPDDIKLQFHVTTVYYLQLLRVENEQLIKPVSPTDVMSYKDCPIYIDDRISSITLSPVRSE